ncbi:polyprotein [Rhynchospora pubera]|uniref:Polyprotein n=1 Tax=Rhynchospora pubera TaxID=906938 RepID=A0AAV8FD24_9POAL|nr:polyprotein [Rhynchospora pubera]
MANPSDSTTSSPTISQSSPMESIIPLNLPISTKLSQNNYLTWKSQILPIIHGYNLTQYILSLPPNPTITTENNQIVVNPEFSSWHRQDQLLLGWLRSSLTEPIQDQVVSSNSTFDLWNSLQRIFSNKSKARLHDLRRQIQSATKGGSTCSEYIQHIRNLADELLFIGSPMSEEDLVMATLNGLGSEYLPFITSITTSLRSDPITFSDLHGLLLTHESLLLSHHTSQTNAAAFTNFRQPNRPQNRSNYFPQLPHVRNAGTTVFTQSDNSTGKLPITQKPNNSNVSPKPRIPCQICAKPNHSAKLCYFRYEPDPNWKPNPKFQAFAAQAPNATTDTSTWVLDSGANNHVTSDINNLSSFNYTGLDSLQVGNGSGLQIQNIGNASFTLSDCTINLNNVLHVPAFTCNLISVSKLLLDNPQLLIEFSSSMCIIKLLPTKTVLLKLPSHNGLYTMKFTSQFVALLGVTASANKWHKRLGHPSNAVTLDVVNGFRLPCNANKMDMCHDCCVSKAHRLPFSLSTSVTNAPLELIHSDVWGPSPVLSHNGFKYYIVFIDDFSKFSWVYFMQSKSEVPQIFTKFKLQVENLLQSKIKVLRTDGGSEYKPIDSHYPELVHQTSCPYTPQQNGLSERKHRHLIELTLANMSQANAPSKYWDEFLSSVNYLINRLPSSHKTVPYTVLFHKDPDYSMLKVLGCLCFSYTRPYNQHKLQLRALPCVFLGYAQSQKGYRCLHIPTNKIYISRHVQFDEDTYPFSLQSTTSSNNSTSTNFNSILSVVHSTPPISPTNNNNNTTTLTNETTPVPAINDNTAPSLIPHTSPSTPLPAQTPIPPSIQTTSHHMTTRQKDNTRKARTFPNHVTYLTTSDNEPKSYSKALLIPEWRQAMATEINALAKNKTWSLVPKPLNQTIIGCKWVYKLKRKADGSIERFKARLVAKGFSQTEGVDFFETYSPVIRPSTIRAILSIDVSSGWQIQQLDVQNAFLHGDLTEAVYMHQPPGFEDQNRPDHVFLLSKALYGLKQAPRAWFEKLSNTLQILGFSASQYDPSLFFKISQGQHMFILIYVDDILITGSNSDQINACISLLHSQFAIRDLGSIHYFLGIEATVCKEGLMLNQTKYIENLLTKHNMMTAKPCTTPMATFTQFTSDDSELFEDPQLYRSAVGALQYATLTRPDISFAVNKCAQFMHNPTNNHWIAVKRVLRYLKGTVSHAFLIQSQSSLSLHAYSDSDWAGSVDDRRSTSGFCLYLGRNLISWSAKKQPTVSRSSTEAEYRSLALACTEVMWLENLLKELHISLIATPTLWCDNIGATFLASNPSFHARTKHIEIDYHFVRERILTGQLMAKFLCSADQIADIMTKPLPTIRHQFLRSKLNVVVTNLACGGCNNSTLDKSSNGDTGQINH